MEEIEEQHDIGASIRKPGAVAHHIAQHGADIGKTCRLRFRSQVIEHGLFDVDRDNLAACAARGGECVKVP